MSEVPLGGFKGLPVRFINQKLGKRISRKFDLLKSRLASEKGSGKSSATISKFPKPRAADKNGREKN